MDRAALSDFKRLISARFFFTLAVQMQVVVVGWRVYDLTKDPLSLGLMGLAEAVPALSLALYAGYIVDRTPPLKAYRWVLKGSLFSVFILLASALLQNHTDHATQVAALYVASFFTGAARAFSQPAMFAIVPRLLKRESLAQAQALILSHRQRRVFLHLRRSHQQFLRHHTLLIPWMRWFHIESRLYHRCSKDVMMNY